MRDDALKRAKLLIVDDEPGSVQLLERTLKGAGYTQLLSTSDARQVLPLYLECQPDLLLLDLRMPHLDGFAVMRQLTPRIPVGSFFPILVLTVEVTPETKHRALKEGAHDFLSKPFDTTEVLLRIRNLLTTRFLHRTLEGQNERLEEQVRERTSELVGAQVEILERLSLIAEYRDDASGEHTYRVGRVAALLAQTLGWSPDQVELIRRAAPLHDIGKIGIPDRVLLKPGKLTSEEFVEMKDHIMVGAKTLSGSRSPLLQLAEVIALTHHERWDGTGYMQLKGEDIPLPGRIVTVADVFDALTHTRQYKEAWPIDRARAEIVRVAGVQFDPQVVEAFLRVLEREGESLTWLGRTADRGPAQHVLSTYPEGNPWAAIPSGSLHAR